MFQCWHVMDGFFTSWNMHSGKWKLEKWFLPVWRYKTFPSVCLFLLQVGFSAQVSFVREFAFPVAFQTKPMQFGILAPKKKSKMTWTNIQGKTCARGQPTFNFEGKTYQSYTRVVLIGLCFVQLQRIARTNCSNESFERITWNNKNKFLIHDWHLTCRTMLDTYPC